MRAIVLSTWPALPADARPVGWLGYLRLYETSEVAADEWLVIGPGKYGEGSASAILRTDAPRTS